ncbi:GNAT family N-acetyltransferase [Terribacillus sp. 179-K 1B1 HS]|uniref:GNAT family N-acetyltransferase n=1 Tax=Terribacillus sp. 179-K 1B1 HS TaxID=3142388 RepID=UPI0039A0AA23
MEFFIRRRTNEDINEFIPWTYEGIYSSYDNNIQQEKIDALKKSVNLERAFTVIDDQNNLVGNCEFYDVKEDENQILVVGLQMKPSLTGQGNGTEFFRAIIEQGRQLLKYDHLELAVADFNKRAIRTYEKEGFVKRGEFENKIRGADYNFIIMAKDW